MLWTPPPLCCRFFPCAAAAVPKRSLLRRCCCRFRLACRHQVSVCQSVYLSIGLSVRPSVGLSVRLSVGPSICRSFHMSFLKNPSLCLCRCCRFRPAIYVAANPVLSHHPPAATADPIPRRHRRLCRCCFATAVTAVLTRRHLADAAQPSPRRLRHCCGSQLPPVTLKIRP